MKGTVLFVLTGNGTLGESGEETGFDLTETAIPHHILSGAGYAVEFATPEGGRAPVDPASTDRDDPDAASFLDDSGVVDAIRNTQRAAALDAEDYVGIYFSGGHGTMWDFPESEALQDLTREIFENGGVVAGICHGPSAWVNLRLSDGSYFVAGRRIACFTNDEEYETGKAEVVPFLLESKLRERGAEHTKAHPYDEHVEVDGRVVTGQNPASAESLGHEMVRLLDDVVEQRPAAE